MHRIPRYSAERGRRHMHGDGNKVKVAQHKLQEMCGAQLISPSTSSPAGRMIYNTFIRPLYEYGWLILPSNPSTTVELDKLDSTLMKVVLMRSGSIKPNQRTKLRAFFAILEPIRRHRTLTKKFVSALQSAATPRTEQTERVAEYHIRQKQEGRTL